MKVDVYSVEGKPLKKVDLPSVFKTPYRPDLILRAVTAIQSHRIQPKGVYYLAGKDTSAEYVGRRGDYRAGINRGTSRLPRTKPGGGGLGEVRRVPHAKGGLRAHPPKVEKVIGKKINAKERKLALMSAIAASGDITLVRKRHKVGKISLPIIIEDKAEKLKKTKDVEKMLEPLGLADDIKRTKNKKIRAGIGKMRGRKYKKKKSVLIIATSKDLIKAANNIPGVDAVLVKDLNTELLAPGGHAGRLTIWTESAINEASKRWVYASS